MFPNVLRRSKYFGRNPLSLRDGQRNLKSDRQSIGPEYRLLMEAVRPTVRGQVPADSSIRQAIAPN
jgi:hypothetical protein